MKPIRPTTTSILLSLFLCGVAMQVAILVGRSGSVGSPPSAPAPPLVGDTLVELMGLAADGSDEVLEFLMQPGAATVVYAFSSECVFCDDVAPQWATHFQTPSPEPIRRVAITRDGPTVAAKYAGRFRWDVGILSMPDLTATDRRSSFLSRTPWLYVFDHQGVLQFQGHGSSLDLADEITWQLTHPLGVRIVTPDRVGVGGL